jgi:hypothetical protein
MKNTIFALAFLAASTCMAATKITYDEIPKHLGRFGAVLAYRGFTVTTSDGKPHSGRRLLLESDHLRIFHRDNSYEDLPGVEVTRIEIRQAGRFFHHIAEENAGILLFFPLFAFVDPPDSIPLILFTPPALAYVAATTPFFLAADGVAFLIPPKVYEIVH